MSVSVIIPCHNYGRYLKECLQSVLAQTFPATEIIVVDDSSTDDTSTIANSYKDQGVAYIKVEHKSCYQTRKTGLNKTTSEYIIFLDADDKLDQTYIERCLEAFKQYPKLGIVTTNLSLFGEKTGPLIHKTCNINHNNWIHAGSMVKRTSLVSSGAYTASLTTSSTCEDWYMWRKVINDGWAVGRTPEPIYHYRQHPNSMMKTQPVLSYYNRAHLADEPVTLVLPLARSRYLPRLKEWLLDNESAYSHIMVIDSTDETGTVWSILANCSIKNVQYIRLDPSNGLEDHIRDVNNGTYHSVQIAMTKIYRHLRHLNTEYAHIVEDDVLPPNNCCKQLLAVMDYNVAAVSAVVPSRIHPNRILSGDIHGRHLVDLEGRIVPQEVQYSGFGCLLVRRSIIEQVAPPNSDGCGNYDVNFFKETGKLGYKHLLNWGVRCKHGD